MTLLTLTVAIAFASPQAACPLPQGSLSEKRVFTNADLDLMAACRYQTGAQSEAGTVPARTVQKVRPPAAARPVVAPPRTDAVEEDWRARWRSVDQKARRLRREARELRQEAAEAPRDPRKRPTGRRSPSLLIARALALESEARELEADFEDRARREGALPGWLRPRGR